ncbi:TPA: glycosyltransferase family 4 protein, partial [Escherichia coli]|nr:glycosyltransferase family 4 protein [Escherichia coli]
FIGHHLVVRNYQELIDEVAIQLRGKNHVYLITPKYYKEKVLTQAGNFGSGNFSHIKLSTVLSKQGRQHAHFYIGLNRHIKKIKPKLIYCMEEPNSVVSAQVCYYAKKNRIKVVLWSALNQFRNYRHYKYIDPRRYIFTACLNYTFKNSLAINALDNSVAKVLLEKGYTGRIFINNTFGVNKSFFTKPKLVKDKCLKIIYVGVLENYKGVNFLISAIKGENVRLDIIGDGTQRKKLELLAKGKNIGFHGFQDQSYIENIMRSSDVLILPSVPVDGYLEQFGRVLIEAMASGCCVAGSSIGGIPAVIAENGFLFEHSNVTAIEDIINELKSDSEKLFLYKDKGYKYALDTYSYNSVAKRIVEQMEIMLNECN